LVGITSGGQNLLSMAPSKARRYMTRNLRRSAGKWMKELMRRLLQITHQQWTYRNATVHLKVTDGSEALVAEIFECTHVNPDELLEEHKHLVESNFTKLEPDQLKTK
jgi:hypothetical protein